MSYKIKKDDLQFEIDEMQANGMQVFDVIQKAFKTKVHIIVGGYAGQPITDGNMALMTKELTRFEIANKDFLHKKPIEVSFDYKPLYLELKTDRKYWLMMCKHYCLKSKWWMPTFYLKKKLRKDTNWRKHEKQLSRQKIQRS